MADASTIDFDSLMSQPSSATPQGGGQTIDFDSLMAKQAPAPVGKSSGLVANVGAGLNEAIANTAGAPVDLLTGAVNLLGRGISSGYQPIQNPVGGSESIKSGLGLLGADPENVTANTAPERVARNVGQGIGSMVVPGIGAEAALGSAAASKLGPVSGSILAALRGGAETPASAGATAGNIGKNALIGAGAGTGQGVAEEAAPEGQKGLWGTAGALLGSALPISGEAAFRFAMSRPTVQAEAANRVLGNVTDQEAFKTAMNEPVPDVPGVTSTPAKMANDAGALQMENWARNQRQETFGEGAAQDNAARVAALKSVAPTAGMSPGQLVTNHLDRLDASLGAVESAASARAQDTLAQIGVGHEPMDIGDAIPSIRRTARSCVTLCRKVRQPVMLLSQGYGISPDRMVIWPSTILPRRRQSPKLVG